MRGASQTRLFRSRWQQRRGLQVAALAEPELDPDEERSMAYGQRACPPRALQPLMERVETTAMLRRIQSVAGARTSRSAPHSGFRITVRMSGNHKLTRVRGAGLRFRPSASRTARPEILRAAF